MSEVPDKDLAALCNKVTTSSPECLEWIDKGLIQIFNFNHSQAIVNLKKALSFDSQCAMAHYFIAYSHAGHYNNPEGFEHAVGSEEARTAQTLSQSLTLKEWEFDLIEAQLHRFCLPVGSVPLNTRTINYVNAMRLVYQKHEGNLDVAVFFAESLMSLAPWKLWTKPPNIKATIPETLELVQVLEKALGLAPVHPGLCHYYIHTMELSATPEKALPAADVLRCRYGEYGHLLHMASHIDIWVGQYKQAIEANQKAIAADHSYISARGEWYDFYTYYQLHNYQFLTWAAMFNGEYTVAMKCAEDLKSQIGPNLISLKFGDVPFGLIHMEPFASVDWHVLVRFGKWEDIINRPINENKKDYPSSVVMARYARGVAFAALGKQAEAEKERELFFEVRTDSSFAQRCMLSNFMYDPNRPGEGILDIAEAVLNGEIEYRKGNFKEAFDQLRLAVKRDCNLEYSEPWSWMMPTRHVLGALLLESGNAAESESVYREDLEQYRNNIWSLMGLHQSLKQQNKLEEADSVLALFQIASASAEIKIGASCLCATKLCF